MTTKLITYPLIIIIFACIISSIASIVGINSQLTIGQDFSINILGADITFTISTQGIILLLVLVGIIGLVTGIQVLGSGISTVGQTIIYKSIFYFGLWGIFSALGVLVILSIPIVGSVVWLLLTLFYSVGVQEQITTHPS